MASCLFVVFFLLEDTLCFIEVNKYLYIFNSNICIYVNKVCTSNKNSVLEITDNKVDYQRKKRNASRHVSW